MPVFFLVEHELSSNRSTIAVQRLNMERMGFNAYGGLRQQTAFGLFNYGIRFLLCGKGHKYLY